MLHAMRSMLMASRDAAFSGVVRNPELKRNFQNTHLASFWGQTT